MRSNAVTPGQSGTASQYNSLRQDAYGGSELLAHQQGTANMTLYVEPGAFYIGTTRVIFGGGNSPSFTAPVSHPRIDILTIDNSGTLAITQGTEATSPVVPSYPTNKAVLCEVYNRVSETSIKDTDDSMNGYIYNDVRPVLAPPYISSTSQVASGLFVPDPGSDAQGDLLYYNGSSWARLPAGTSGFYLETKGSGANPQWNSPSLPTSNGVSSSSASGTQTIAHGLGRTPVLFRMIGGASSGGTATGPIFSIGGYNGTNNFCTNLEFSSGNNAGVQTHSVCFEANFNTTGGTMSCTATWDSTNIYLSWTLTGTMTAAFYWEAM